MSHPTWVRGLKLQVVKVHPKLLQSHPTWVRGLKHIRIGCNIIYVSRTLRGCVD